MIKKDRPEISVYIAMSIDGYIARKDGSLDWLERGHAGDEDLGILHPSLVGPLTRSPSVVNIQEAESALIAYVRRIGRMQVDTLGKSAQFTSILNRVYPQALRFNFLLEVDVSDMLNQFKLLIAQGSNELAQEIHKVLEFSKSCGDFNVLLHGDICPDNVYYQGHEIKLIDFEFGDFGNALIDGVYLRMNMPSCWCSKAVPETVLHKMETAYKEELKKVILEANNNATYDKYLTYACAYWLIRTISKIYDETTRKVIMSSKFRFTFIHLKLKSQSLVHEWLVQPHINYEIQRTEVLLNDK